MQFAKIAAVKLAGYTAHCAQDQKIFMCQNYIKKLQGCEVKIWCKCAEETIGNNTTSLKPDVVVCSVSVIPLHTQKLFSLHIFRLARPPQRVDCLTPRWETALSVFPKHTAMRYCIESRTKGFATFRLLVRRLYLPTEIRLRHISNIDFIISLQ